MAAGKRRVAGAELGYLLAQLASMNPYVKHKPTPAQLDPYRPSSGVMFRTKDKRWLYKAFGVKPNGVKNDGGGRT